MHEYYCHPLEVVDRGSGTQLKVGDNFNKITGKGLRFNDSEGLPTKGRLNQQVV